MRSKFGRKLLLFMFTLFMILVGMAGANLLVFFLGARTPQEAAQQGDTIPANWSAGVPFMGGGYMEWYTISDAPFLFAATLVMVVSFLAFVMWAYWRQARRRRAKSAADA